ncbi:MAG: preprotein translocase subunit SecG [Steroidobacteraceae bacterium]|nr:preprotein translocase subunit SecG [Steroidobacteraceae bacterium]
MSWLQPLAVVVHVLLAFGIIALVLLQRGKGADAGAGFGAGASGTVFGARGSASFLSRTTAVLATLFFLSSLALSYLFSHGAVPTSVMDRVATEQVQPGGDDGATTTGAPAAPATDVPVAPGSDVPAFPATDGVPAAPAEVPAGQ